MSVAHYLKKKILVVLCAAYSNCTLPFPLISRVKDCQKKIDNCQTFRQVSSSWHPGFYCKILYVNFVFV